MAEFLNEHEQVEMIKNFWKRYGNAIIAMIVAVIILMLGWHYWQNRQYAKLAAASVAYQELLQVSGDKNITAIVMQAQNLMQDFPKTPYATMAAFILVNEQVAANQLDKASSNLKWVLQHSNSPEFKAIASLRLARIMLAQGQADKAIELLKSPPKGFIAAFNLIKGDAYVQQNNAAAAFKAYQNAIHSMAVDDPLMPILKVKLSNLPVTAGESDIAVKG